MKHWHWWLHIPSLLEPTDDGEISAFRGLGIRNWNAKNKIYWPDWMIMFSIVIGTKTPNWLTDWLTDLTDWKTDWHWLTVFQSRGLSESNLTLKLIFALCLTCIMKNNFPRLLHICMTNSSTSRNPRKRQENHARPSYIVQKKYSHVFTFRGINWCWNSEDSEYLPPGNGVACLSYIVSTMATDGLTMFQSTHAVLPV